ncbi:MAG: class I SAM-dependent methyltransferase [Nitrospirae bacterium]|nr:class I SAM-dependent methyltransferase [Nitrospirota bacterium]
MESNAIEAFDQYAEDYDKWFESLPGKALFETEVEAVRMLMQGLEHPFLEVGIGTGRFAKELGIDYGVDPSDEMIKIAINRGIKAEKAEGENLPFKDEFFGGVFILFTLCFTANPERMLSEAKRVLKKDGRLIVGIINKASPWGQLYLKKKGEGHPIYKHAKFYSVDEVVEMIKSLGMTVEAYSSALCQNPSERLYKEPIYDGVRDGAGFVCIRAGQTT